jgi:nucleoside-diphosphate-sugar epimerase
VALYLVTGGAGFIGSHLVEALVLRGERVRVLDNFTTGSRANLQNLTEVEVIDGDIRDVN